MRNPIRCHLRTRSWGARLNGLMQKSTSASSPCSAAGRSWSLTALMRARFQLGCGRCCALWFSMYFTIVDSS